MTRALAIDENQGAILIVPPNAGENHWQPQPANGQVSVRVAPHLVETMTPFSLGTQTLPPGGYVREHDHPEHDEVLHFISGTGKAYVDGVEYVAEPGLTIFVGKGRKHKFANDGSGELHWLWFITPNGLETFFRDVGRPVVVGEPDPTPFARPDNVRELERNTAFS